MLRELRAREDAVSPVIGVVLMVAITVILAAVVGGLVFGIGAGESPPQTSIAMESEEKYFKNQGTGQEANLTVVEFVHESGDTISVDNLRISVNGTTGIGYGIRQQPSNDQVTDPFDTTSEFSAGESAEVVFVNRTGAYSSGDAIYYDPADSVDEITDITFGTEAYIEEIQPGHTVSLIWVSDDGDKAQTLAEYEVPA